MKVEQLKTVYRLLVMAYGEPPKEFTWAPMENGKAVSEPKTYTPQAFYQEFCQEGEDLIEDYVMLMNDPSRPYNQVYEIDYVLQELYDCTVHFLNGIIESSQFIASLLVDDRPNHFIGHYFLFA